MVTKARLPLSASLRNTVHLRAERTTLPQELVMLIELHGSNVLRICFFFFCLSPLDIPLCLFHAYHHVCSWRYRLRLNPNLYQGWYYSLSFSSHFSYSSLHPFYSSPERSSSKTVFLSCKQNIDKKRMVRMTATCLIATPPLVFCLQVCL